MSKPGLSVLQTTCAKMFRFKLCYICSHLICSCHSEVHPILKFRTVLSSRYGYFKTPKFPHLQREGRGYIELNQYVDQPSQSMTQFVETVDRYSCADVHTCIYRMFVQYTSNSRWNGGDSVQTKRTRPGHEDRLI